MNIPVIFLDVDGVLNRFPPHEGDSNSWPPMDNTIPATRESLGWLEEPVGVIQLLVNEGCKIVASSTWRLHMPAARFEEGLGVPVGTVIGATKNLIGGRGQEIAQWRKDFQHDGPFVIIDDDTFDIVCEDGLLHHVVATRTDVGLTVDLIPEIRKALTL